MSVNIGAFLSYLLGGLIPYWQASFIFVGVSVLHFILLFTIRKSPKYSRNPMKNIKRLLVNRRFQHQDDTCPMSKSGYFWRLLLALTILIFQQLGGVSAIVFYAGPILQSTGWDNPAVSADMVASLSIGVVQLLPTFVCIFLVDRFGRRLLLFFGGVGMAFANLGMVMYFGLSYSFLPSHDVSNSTASSCFNNDLSTSSSVATRLESLPLLSIAVFFVAFSLSWGPIAWTLTAEILPLAYRPISNSVGVATYWSFASAVTIIFPILTSSVGFVIPFLIFAILALTSAVIIVLFIPETRGLTLQESNALKFSVKRNVKEFGNLLKWCVRCRFCTCKCVCPIKQQSPLGYEQIN